MIRRGALVLLPVLAFFTPALPQTHTMTEGAHRIELMLERLEGTTLGRGSITVHQRTCQ